MKNNYEHKIFQEELRRLRSEYKRCTDDRIKNEISKDIQLLEHAIQAI